MYVSTIPERNRVSNWNTCIVVVIVIDRSSQTRSVSILLGTLTWVFAWFTTVKTYTFDFYFFHTVSKGASLYK